MAGGRAVCFWSAAVRVSRHFLPALAADVEPGSLAGGRARAYLQTRYSPRRLVRLPRARDR